MKLPGKALLYRDFKYSKWFMLLLFLELFVLFLLPDFVFFNRRSYPKLFLFESMNRYMITLPVITLTIVLLSSSLFYYDRKLVNYTLAASMPFSRNKMITSKWCVGLYIIFVPFFAVYIFMNALLITNFCWQMFFIDITKWFILCLSVSLCIFGFVMMFQSLNGSAITGSIMTLLFAAFPFSLLYPLLGITISHYRNITPPRLIEQVFLRPIGQLYSQIVNYRINISIFKAISLCIVFVSLAAAFYFLSVLIYKKGRYENTGCITMLIAFEKLYKAILSYYAGFFVLVILSIFSTRYAFRPDIAIACCVVLPIPLYLATGKAIKLYSKRLV